MKEIRGNYGGKAYLRIIPAECLIIHRTIRIIAFDTIDNKEDEELSIILSQIP